MLYYSNCRYVNSSTSRVHVTETAEVLSDVAEATLVKRHEDTLQESGLTDSNFKDQSNRSIQKKKKLWT
jgi:hypothetical protein